MALQGLDHGVGLEPGAIKTPEHVLEKERGADGGDEGHQARGVAQGAIGDALEHDGDQGRGRHGDDEHQDQADHGVGFQQPALVEIRREVIGGVGPAHEDLAVGEVDHAQDPVHHGVAHGDEGVDAALGQSEDDEVDPVVGGVDSLDQRGCRAPHDHGHQRGADEPHDHVGRAGALSQSLQHGVSDPFQVMGCLSRTMAFGCILLQHPG